MSGKFDNNLENSVNVNFYAQRFFPTKDAHSNPMFECMHNFIALKRVSHIFNSLNTFLLTVIANSVLSNGKTSVLQSSSPRLSLISAK